MYLEAYKRWMETELEDSALNAELESIEGNEEEELQQERIAGGAAGEAHSKVEELHGITDYSEGEYVPKYGID